MTTMDEPPPALTLGAVNIACPDPASLAAFWAEATGGVVSGSSGGAVYVTPAPGGIPFFFQPGDTPGAGETTHLDLTVAPGTRLTEVDRLIALGAVWRWEVVGEIAWVDWTTLADPAGNLFCVAEHHATG